MDRLDAQRARSKHGLAWLLVLAIALVYAFSQRALVRGLVSGAHRFAVSLRLGADCSLGA
jgi:hypothetical protein